MIFPFLSGIQSIFRAPVTWLIFFLNFLTLVVTHERSDKYQAQLEDLVQNTAFGRIQGQVFADFIERHPSQYSPELRELAQKTEISGDHQRQALLGGLALRDSYFMGRIHTVESGIDPIALGWWKNKMTEIEDIRAIHPSYGLGLNQEVTNRGRWLTYQFTHSGYTHFLGNMLFFLIFASSLEVLIGGLGVLIVYLLSGLVAAMSFSLISESTTIPLIGASGAVSGIMALFCVLAWGRGVRYIYFLFVPKRGFAGIIYLPAWITLILWMLTDLAGFLATPNAMSGVAYTAHLGGEFCGIVVGLILISLRKIRKQPIVPEPFPLPTQPVFTQIV